jgi:hypothetical protein
MDTVKGPKVSTESSHAAGLRAGGPSERRAAVVLLGLVAAFQAAIAAGAPVGPLAYGGAHGGVLPDRLRVTSAAAVVVWTGLGTVVARPQLVPPRPRRWLLTGAAGAVGVGALLNLASPSLPERVAWTPVSTGLAALLWRLAARERRERG